MYKWFFYERKVKMKCWCLILGYRYNGARDKPSWSLKQCVPFDTADGICAKQNGSCLTNICCS